MHKVAADAAGPAVLYAQNHHGVYRTDDGGLQWTSIAEGLPSDFGFFVARLAAHAGHRLGDAAGRRRASASRRAAGCACTAPATAAARGRSSAPGCPTTPWTVVLRDAACVDSADPTGVYLGTRDGCVYASTDEGETFALVAEHLPDVLSVRAAVVP